MALSIKDEATDRLVRRYAALRQTSFTDAIKLAVGDALRREEARRSEDEDERFTARIRALQDKVSGYTRNSQTDEEIMGYGEDGTPQ